MKKELLTKELILKDIKHAGHYYSPKDRDRVDKIVICICCVIVVLVSSITYSPRTLLLLLVPLAYATVRAVIDSRKCKKVSAEDITVDTAKLVSVHDWLEDAGNIGFNQFARRYEKRLTLYFSSGEWDVPRETYTWSNELHMSMDGINHTSLAGETFYVVRIEKTGEIVYAYNQKFFSYRGD